MNTQHDHLIAGEEKNCHQCTPAMNTQQAWTKEQMGVCPNCEQWQHRDTKTGLRDCLNSCISKGLAIDTEHMNTQQTKIHANHGHKYDQAICSPVERLRHHVTGAIERGEADAIAEQRDTPAQARTVPADRPTAIKTSQPYIEPATPAQAHSPLHRTNFRGELIQNEPEILNRLLARAERAEAHAQRLADALAIIRDATVNPFVQDTAIAALAQWEGDKQS